jgi:hypothetical protein
MSLELNSRRLGALAGHCFATQPLPATRVLLGDSEHADATASIDYLGAARRNDTEATRRAVEGRPSRFRTRGEE